MVCSALAPRRLVGPLRALPGGPASPPGFAPGLGPCGPLGRAGPGSGPLRRGRPALGALVVVVASRRCPRLRGSLGLSAGRLRPSARPRPSPGGPRCGVAGSGPRRPCLAGGSAPSSGGLGRGALVACRPLSGALRSCRRPACAPSLVAPGPPPRGPAGRPGFRPGPPRLLPPGAAGGGYAALFRAAAPFVGAAPVSAVVGVPWGRGPVPTLPTLRQGSRQAAQAPPLTACVPGGKLSPRARDRALSFDRPFILGLTASNKSAIIGRAREFPNRWHFGAHKAVAVGGFLFFCHPPPRPAFRGRRGAQGSWDTCGIPVKNCRPWSKSRSWSNYPRLVIPPLLY